MVVDPVEKIAAAVLYEGYVLWPYRRSSTKNQKRWTLGGVYPRAYSEANGGHDPWLMQTECPVVGEESSVEITVRFLHVVERRVGRTTADGEREFVDELRVGTERHLAWEEATEREIAVTGVKLSTLTTPRRVCIEIPAGSEEENLTAPDGVVVGVLVRSWRAMEGEIEIGAQAAGDGVFRLTVRIANTTPWSDADRDRTHQQTFVSIHAILRVQGGEFVSLVDPPAGLEQVVAACENVKMWPVLVGENGDKHTMLSSPIILYDYPQIAPESPGDLFDGTEIDQMLTLNILAMTDAEKEEMRATDPRSREILERTEALTNDELMGLHGAIREFRYLAPETDLFETLERPPAESVIVDNVEIRKGSRVLLLPRPGGDIMDLALAGKTAIVEGIDQDYEDRIHLSVTVEDDPGRDLGVERVLGHRFFFSPDEVRPLKEDA